MFLLYKGAEMADRSSNCLVTDSDRSVITCFYVGCQLLCIWSVLFRLL